MYSQLLQEQTKEHFQKHYCALMKQFGGDFGIGVVKDEIFTIFSRKSGQKYEYTSIDTLIKAKWVID